MPAARSPPAATLRRSRPHAPCSLLPPSVSPPPCRRVPSTPDPARSVQPPAMCARARPPGGRARWRRHNDGYSCPICT
eukprot:1372194-Pleurochrysis_carterae.AAC.1